MAQIASSQADLVPSKQAKEALKRGWSDLFGHSTQTFAPTSSLVSYPGTLPPIIANTTKWWFTPKHSKLMGKLSVWSERFSYRHDD